MDRAELLGLAEAEGIDPFAFSLIGGHASETYVLASRPGGWAVYFAERGVEVQRREFATEDEACRDLLSRLRRDPTVHYALVVGPLSADRADAAFERWKATYSLTSLATDDVRVDNSVFRAGERPLRRYWVRRTKLRQDG